MARLLLVVENLDVIKLVVLIAHSAGHETTAVRLDELPAHLLAGGFDAVLFELELLEPVVQFLYEANAALPLLALSGDPVTPDELLRLRQRGVREVLGKPLAIPAIVAALEGALAIA